MQMRFPNAALSALAALALSAAPLSAEPNLRAAPAALAGADWTDVDRAKLFDAVVEATEKNFFDAQRLRETNWRASAAATRAAVLEAPDATQAVARINALLGELKTSHTVLLTPDDYQYYFLLDIVGAGAGGSEFLTRLFWGSGPYYPGTGAFTRLVDGRPIVDAVLEGSPAAQAGIRVGDEILGVDGAPYSPIAAFRGRIGERVHLSLRRTAAGAPQPVAVEVIPIQPKSAFSAATRASARIIEHAGSRIGYVHVWALHESDSVAAALAEFDPEREERRRGRGREEKADDSAERKPPDYLIVDLRGRVGGTAGVAQRLLELLDDGRKPYWGDSRVYGRERTISTRKQAASYRGRSVLLIDHNTRSAGEIMAHGYKRSGFGSVLGMPTAGAVSSGGTYVMPGDLLLYVAVAGHEFDGRPLEGAGVAPDRRIERPLPYAAGADPVLDAALDLLAQQARH